MLRAALAVFMIGGVAGWCQSQSNAAGRAEKVDRAAAYYHYTVARMYADMAANSRSRSREYVKKAIENYQAAIQADPQTAMLRDELLMISARAHVPVPLMPSLPRLPESRQDRPTP